MKARLAWGKWLHSVVALLVMQLVLPLGIGADATPVRVAGTQVQEVFHLRIPRDGHLLESVTAAIKDHDIRNGAVLTGIGSVQECAYHRSKSLGPDNADEFYKVSGAMELLNLDGIITDGKPHLHITFSNEKGAFGGHLDDCRVLRGVEVLIVKFAPTH